MRGDFEHTQTIHQNLITKIMLALAILAAVFVITKPAHSMGLRPSATLSDGVIRLGDVFEDVPRDADKILGPAPRPGQEMVLNARTLARIAISLDLPWRPESAADTITLRRAATVIDHTALSNGLRDALQAKGVPGAFEIELPNETAKIILPESAPARFEIAALDYDVEKGWLKARIDAPDSINPIETLEITGKLTAISQVPVLNTPLRSGDVIRERHVSYIPLPSSRLNPDAIVNAQDLIGMTPRKVLTEGQPIRASEIEAPVVVGRGDTVMVYFKSGALELTTQGKALEDGAKGDLVRVVNLSSKRTVEAMVSGEREVTVQSF